MHGPYLLMSVKPPKRKIMEMRRVEFMMLFFFLSVSGSHPINFHVQPT